MHAFSEVRCGGGLCECAFSEVRCVHAFSEVRCGGGLCVHAFSEVRCDGGSCVCMPLVR